MEVNICKACLNASGNLLADGRAEKGECDFCEKNTYIQCWVMQFHVHEDWKRKEEFKPDLKLVGKNE